MIFLEISFFRHYVFAVVQTAPSPTQPGGEPPLPCARGGRRCRVQGTGCRLDTMDEVDIVDIVDAVDIVDIVDAVDIVDRT